MADWLDVTVFDMPIAVSTKIFAYLVPKTQFAMKSLAAAFQRLRFNSSPEITAVVYSCLLREGFVYQEPMVIKPRAYLPILAPWNVDDAASLAGA